MKPIYFIADLHLSETHPEFNRYFFNDFMQNQAPRSTSGLYFGGSFLIFGLVTMKLHL